MFVYDQEPRVRTVCTHIQEYFPADIADELNAHDGGLYELAQALESAADVLGVRLVMAVWMLSRQITDHDAAYIRGELELSPADAGEYLACKIEADNYLSLPVEEY